MYSDFYGCERGNTLLVSEGGNFIAWLKLDDGYYLEVSWVSENYPSLQTAPINSSEEELVAHIHSKCGGYYVRKCNLAGVRYSDDNAVVGDDEIDEEDADFPWWKVTE